MADTADTTAPIDLAQQAAPSARHATELIDLGRHRPMHPPRRRVAWGSRPIIGSLTVVLLGALVGAGAAVGAGFGEQPPPAPTAAAATITPSPDGIARPDALGDPLRVHVGRVVAVPDGETVVVSLPSGTARVSIIGVDAPTGIECGAGEATAHARAALLDKDVTLLPDVTLTPEPGREARYVVERVRQLSYTDAAVADGVARADLRPAWYEATYRGEEAGARNAGRGLWGRCSP